MVAGGKKNTKGTTPPPSRFRANHSYTDLLYKKWNLSAAVTHSLYHRLCSWATHSAVMQFEGIDTDRNYDSCPCRRERESGSSYTKNIQQSRASSSSTALKASTAEAVQYMLLFLPHCNSHTPIFFLKSDLFILKLNVFKIKLKILHKV